MCLTNKARITSTMPLLAFKELIPTQEKNVYITPYRREKVSFQKQENFLVSKEQPKQMGYFFHLKKEQDFYDTITFPCILQPKNLLYTDFVSITATEICLLTTDSIKESVFVPYPLLRIFQEYSKGIRAIDLFIRPSVSFYMITIIFSNCLVLEIWPEHMCFSFQDKLLPLPCSWKIENKENDKILDLILPSGFVTDDIFDIDFPELRSFVNKSLFVYKDMLWNVLPSLEKKAQVYIEQGKNIDISHLLSERKPKSGILQKIKNFLTRK